MKSALIVYAAILIVAVHAADELPQEFKQKVVAKVHAVGVKCAAQEKATPEDISELLARKAPSRKEGKCLIACFNQAFGSQDADGKLSEEGSIKALQPFKEVNEDIYNRMVKLTQDCMAEVKATDRCEIAAEMAHCANVNAAAAGLSPEMLF